MLHPPPVVATHIHGYTGRFALEVLQGLGAEVHAVHAGAAIGTADIVLTDRIDLLERTDGDLGHTVLVELRPPAADDDANARIAEASGIGAVIGGIDGPGLPPPGRMLEALVGVHAAIAALAAHAGARRDGEGEHVVVDPVETIAAVSGVNAIQFLNYGRRWRRSGPTASGSGGPYPFRLFPCADGWVVVICRSREEWASFLALLGNPPWASEPDYADPLEIASHHADAVTALVVDQLRSRTVDELVADAHRHRVPLAPLRSVEDAVADPRLFLDGDPARPHPAFDVVDVTPRPTRWQSRTAPSRHDGPRAAPLAGARVLDLGWVWAAPVAAAWLADLGADVIKVESLERLDVARRRGIEFPIGDARSAATDLPGYERAWVFNAVNRNKRSVRLELKEEHDRDRFLELVAASDLVIESFSAGVLERLRLGPEVLFDVNPHLVLVSMGGRTVDGDYVGRSYAPMHSALAGIERQVVDAEGRPLGLLNWGVADPGAGTWATLAAVAALTAGRGGRHLLVSQLRSLVNTCRSTYVGSDPPPRPLDDPPEVTAAHLDGTATGPLGEVYRRVVHRSVTPDTGERLAFQPPWNFQRMPVSVRCGAPLLGSTPVGGLWRGEPAS